jgi:hypothetical protein
MHSQLEMNAASRLKTNRIFSSLGFKLWLPVAVGGAVALLLLGYMVVRNDRGVRWLPTAASSRDSRCRPSGSIHRRPDGPGAEYGSQCPFADEPRCSETLLSVLNGRQDLYGLILIRMDGIEQIRLVRSYRSRLPAQTWPIPAFRQVMSGPGGQNYFGQSTFVYVAFADIATSLRDASGVPTAVWWAAGRRICPSWPGASRQPMVW